MSLRNTQIPSPCFVLEEEKLLANLKLIQSIALATDVKIILALKGFAMHSVFDVMREFVPGTTASSMNEARLAEQTFGGEIHAYATVYFDDEIDDWARMCRHITFNSINQYEKYRSKMTSINSCGLRINPEYSEVDTEIYNPCAPGSRLGIRAIDLPNNLPEGIEGFHFHSLCENNSFALENTLKAVEEKFGKWLSQLKWLNLGGGHLITHADYDTEHLVKVLHDFQAKYPNLHLIMEPGSAFAWQTGSLVSTVQDYFHSDGIDVAILDVSISAHMPDCLEMPYTPEVEGAEVYTQDHLPTTVQPVRLGGTSCLAGDYVGDYYFKEGLQIGDRVVFKDMMHYTMVKTTFFNGVKHPSIGILRKDDSFELVKEFGYESFKSKLS